MTTLKLYNTEIRKKQEITPADPGGRIRLYTCGPTVYHYAHIGNFRAYVFEDLLRRTLQFFGLEVEQVMNITDVDDKTIKGALQKGVSLEEYVEPYIAAFFEDLDALHIERAEHYPKATEYIPQMISYIQQLLDKRVAYRGEDNSVYFSIAAFPGYGRLSHLKLDDLEAGRSQRVASDEYDKESMADFVLWKAYDSERDGGIFWESPFGKGRPGWHMECSAMAMEILGSTVDIHCGGVDNIFPHHENEIAQSESCSGCQFSRFWAHAEHLIVDGKKMSKSFGNFYTLRDLLEQGYTGRQVRYMLLHTHYRQQLNFTFEELQGVCHSIDRLDSFVQRLEEVQKGEPSGLEASMEETRARFTEALADDLNISAALAALFDFVREGNIRLDAERLSKEEAEAALGLLRELNRVFGIISFDDELVPQEVVEMAAERQEARASRDFAKADALRDRMADLGYVVEDRAGGGPRIKRRVPER